VGNSGRPCASAFSLSRRRLRVRHDRGREHQVWAGAGSRSRPLEHDHQESGSGTGGRWEAADRRGAAAAGRWSRDSFAAPLPWRCSWRCRRATERVRGRLNRLVDRREHARADPGRALRSVPPLPGLNMVVSAAAGAGRVHDLFKAAGCVGASRRTATGVLVPVRLPGPAFRNAPRGTLLLPRRSCVPAPAPPENTSRYRPDPPTQPSDRPYPTRRAPTLAPPPERCPVRGRGIRRCRVAA
jgi:hypothetical protein